MRYCPNCKEERDGNFCLVCGFKFEVEEELKKEQENPQENICEEIQERPKEKNRENKIMMCIAIAGTIFIIMAIIFGTICHHEWIPANCVTPMTCSLCEKTRGGLEEHIWIDPTCEEPQTCEVCKETSGEPLGHTWIDATCVEAKICEVCEEKEGLPLGHDVNDWTIVTESSCSAEGMMTGKCNNCGLQIEETIEMIEHTQGEWTIVKEATPDAKGTRQILCTVCGAVVEEESYSLTAEQKEQYYKDHCQSISYDNLSRYPQDYEGEYVRFRGRVVQVCYEASSPLYYSTYRVATSGKYDDVVFIYVSNYGNGARILEDDWITFYGKYDGLYTYETVMGASLTIPSIKVEYYD